MLGIFMLLLSSSDLFQNQLFNKKSFRNTIPVSNGLDPDQDQSSVGLFAKVISIDKSCS